MISWCLSKSSGGDIYVKLKVVNIKIPNLQQDLWDFLMVFCIDGFISPQVAWLLEPQIEHCGD